MLILILDSTETSTFLFSSLTHPADGKRLVTGQQNTGLVLVAYLNIFYPPIIYMDRLWPFQSTSVCNKVMNTYRTRIMFRKVPCCDTIRVKGMLTVQLAKHVRVVDLTQTDCTIPREDG